jgi:hypothetical protein
MNSNSGAHRPAAPGPREKRVHAGGGVEIPDMGRDGFLLALARIAARQLAQQPQPTSTAAEPAPGDDNST